MGMNTKIEWAHHSFNPWYGCQKVGPGCDHCYAESWAKRSGLVQWGPHAQRRRSSPANWRKPMAWNAEAARLGVRYRVFCASLADVFDNAVPAAWREDLFRLIAATPHLDWLVVTKRIGNSAEMMFQARGGWLPILDNLWLGITVVDQAEADRDLPKLLRVPARVRFLSLEPLLGEISFRWAKWVNAQEMHGQHGCHSHLDGLRGLHWVIVGGESGPQARPMHPDWVRSLRDQCAAAAVPFLLKQWGEWAPAAEYYTDDDQAHDAALDRPHILLTRSGYQWNEDHDGQPALTSWIMHRVGKAQAGRLLDGIEHNGYPAVNEKLRVGPSGPSLSNAGLGKEV